MTREKAQVAPTARPKVPVPPGRGGLLRSSNEAGVMLVERREPAIAIWLGSTGNGRNPMFNGRRQPSRGGTSRMTRECQVRFCEGLGVKFPGPTRHSRHFEVGGDESGLPPIPDVLLQHSEPTLRANCRHSRTKTGRFSAGLKGARGAGTLPYRRSRVRFV
jgi:hypothetical protein